MRAIRRAASAVLLGSAVLAAALWTAAAGAQGRGGLQAQVTPRVVTAGGRVMLTVRGCPGETTVSSQMFGTVRLGTHSPPRTVTVGGGGGAPAGAQGAPPAGTGGDPARAAAKDHEVRFRCADGAVRTLRLTVTGGQGGQDGPPRHGVRAGTGGSLGGFDLQELAVGTLLLATALGLAYRRSVRHGASRLPPGEPADPEHRTDD